MARMKFLCDAERCIECNGCVTACKQENEVPWGVNRRRVVTINDGIVGAEKSISVACMHCSDAPCMAVCPVDCFYKTEDGVVLHDKDLCIGCGYCFYACPFGAPQFPQAGAFGLRGKMDKCTFCAGGPEPDRSEAEPRRCSAATATSSPTSIAIAWYVAARAPKCGAGVRPTVRASPVRSRPPSNRRGASRDPGLALDCLVRACGLCRARAGRGLQERQVPGQARHAALGQRAARLRRQVDQGRPRELGEPDQDPAARPERRRTDLPVRCRT